MDFRLTDEQKAFQALVDGRPTPARSPLVEEREAE